MMCKAVIQPHNCTANQSLELEEFRKEAVPRHSPNNGRNQQFRQQDLSAIWFTFIYNYVRIFLGILILFPFL